MFQPSSWCFNPVVGALPSKTSLPSSPLSISRFILPPFFGLPKGIPTPSDMLMFGLNTCGASGNYMLFNCLTFEFIKYSGSLPGYIFKGHLSPVMFRYHSFNENPITSLDSLDSGRVLKMVFFGRHEFQNFTQLGIQTYIFNNLAKYGQMNNISPT